jgi:hypothetical protein
MLPVPFRPISVFSIINRHFLWRLAGWTRIWTWGLMLTRNIELNTDESLHVLPSMLIGECG